MRILHLSDTPLSGAPLRLHNLLNKYVAAESKYIMWQDRAGHRYYGAPTATSRDPLEVLRYMIYEWSSHLHFHNRWKRQEVFKALGTPPPKKPSVIQIHNPRESENFEEEIMSKIPIACPAQYHGRQWGECKFIVPNVVDIYDPMYIRDKMPDDRFPTVSYSPSSTNMRGWDDKSYRIVAPVLKRMRYAGEITYQLIQHKPFDEVMALKRKSHIGIDEISTGSYHLSGLEYASLGVPCIVGTDALTDKTMMDCIGSDSVPWIKASHDDFEKVLRRLLKNKETIHDLSKKTREWMQTYWAPEKLCTIYMSMYAKL